MATILSLPAVARLAERHVRDNHAGGLPVDELVGWLVRVRVAPDRARAGVRLAVTCGRLVAAVDGDGRQGVRVPSQRDESGVAA